MATNSSPEELREEANQLRGEIRNAQRQVQTLVDKLEAVERNLYRIEAIATVVRQAGATIDGVVRRMLQKQEEHAIEWLRGTGLPASSWNQVDFSQYTPIETWKSSTVLSRDQLTVFAEKLTADGVYLVEGSSTNTSTEALEKLARLIVANMVVKDGRPKFEVVVTPSSIRMGSVSIVAL